jgi:hypothetical protein
MEWKEAALLDKPVVVCLVYLVVGLLDVTKVFDLAV